MPNRIPLVSWRGITPASLKLPNARSFEPSGLTIYEDQGDPWIFAVGDGKLVKAKLNRARDGKPHKTSWRGPLVIESARVPVKDNDKELRPNDFECVTFAKGKIMLGVEGGRTSKARKTLTTPKVLRFNQRREFSAVGALTGGSWDLGGCIPSNAPANAGMEGLTFIESGSYPSSWAENAPYGGIFLAAAQSAPGGAYVYNLSKSDGQKDVSAAPVDVSRDNLVAGKLSIPAPPVTAPDGRAWPISELCFDKRRGYLWVLYDDAVMGDYLHVFSLDPATGELAAVWGDALPWIGVEGMAVDGNDLYFAIDNNDDSNGVYLLRDFMPSAGIRSI